MCAIDPPPCISRPVPDSHTTLNGILTRMLKKDDPERPAIERSLAYMDTQFGIFERFRAQYTLCRPQVHAEVQALEYFHKRGLSFVGNDPYIACSKPACLCCELYFKYHPARMVVPESHRKVWISWGPPLVERFTKTDPTSQCQRQVLDKMIEEVCRDANGQILRRSPPPSWHPDSQTGITEGLCT